VTTCTIRGLRDSPLTASPPRLTLATHSALTAWQLREISRSTDALEELCAAGPSPVGEMANGVVCKRVVLDTLTGRHVPTRVENFVESSPFFAKLKLPLEHLVGQLFDDTGASTFSGFSAPARG
jgi:hypothetical protein